MPRQRKSTLHNATAEPQALAPRQQVMNIITDAFRDMYVKELPANYRNCVRSGGNGLPNQELLELLKVRLSPEQL